MDELTILGSKVTQPTNKIETFPKPYGVERVILRCSEVTSLCPVTGQPDFETVIIDYSPDLRCVESKSLKLYLWTFREEGHFAEALSTQIAQDILKATDAFRVTVTLEQSPRGGISITAESTSRRSTPARFYGKEIESVDLIGSREALG